MGAADPSGAVFTDQTVMAAKRWGAPDALQEGLIVQACSEDTLFGAHGPLADRLPLTGRLLLTPTLRCVPEESLAYATAQAKLAAGPALRRNYMAIKHKAKGQVARMVMVSTTGRFPTTFLTACGNLTPALGCVCNDRSTPSRARSCPRPSPGTRRPQPRSRRSTRTCCRI